MVIPYIASIIIAVLAASAGLPAVCAVAVLTAFVCVAWHDVKRRFHAAG